MFVRHTRRRLLERIHAPAPARGLGLAGLALIGVLTLAACGSSGRTTYVSAHDQAAIAQALSDLDEKASNCAVESVFRQPNQGSASQDVETLIVVFRKDPDAVDREQHTSMRSLLEHAVTQLQACELSGEATRVRAALATATS